MAEMHGDVDLLGIANLFQMLSMTRCTGFLTLRAKNDTKVLKYDSSGIRLLRGTRRAHPLGDILVRTGRLKRAQVEAILSDQKRMALPFGEMVQREGLLTQSQIDSALREQVAEEIYDLFTWSQARFVFTDDPAAAPAHEGPLSSVVLDTSLMSIMIEAARRLDELACIRALIPDERLVAERLELPSFLDDPALEAEVILQILPLVDGERSIEDVIEDSLYSKFTVLRTLYTLALRGVVKIRDRGAQGEGPSTVVYRQAVRPSPSKEGMMPIVLVASSMETFRAAIALSLRTGGCNVVEHEHLETCIDAIRRCSPDAVVLDLSLETEGGLALCRSVAELGGPPFIVLAANASREATANALRSGARHVLVKPIQDDLLLERLWNVLDTSAVPTSRAG